MGILYHQDGTAPPDGSWTFVFGSNAKGLHYGGAARYALERCGAVMGRPRGKVGQSYGISTCDLPGTPGSFTAQQVADQVAVFVEYAESHPEERFWLTRIGCQRAGFRDDQIAPMFFRLAKLGDRVSFPDVWKPWIGE